MLSRFSVVLYFSDRLYLIPKLNIGYTGILLKKSLKKCSNTVGFVLRNTQRLSENDKIILFMYSHCGRPL